MSDKQTERKHWGFHTPAGDSIHLYPVFETTRPDDGMVDVGSKEVECRWVDVEIKTVDGKETKFRSNYLDLFMFVYMCANEELRQQLQMRYERQASNIPYEVTFSLSAEEKASGKAKRLITLTVDEITMAIARAQARQVAGAKPEFLEQYMDRKKADKQYTGGGKSLFDQIKPR